MSAPRAVGVIGGGRMGAGIAHAFLLAGSEVVLVESSALSAAAAEQHVRASLDKSAQRGAIDAMEEHAARLRTTTHQRALGVVDLVIEAVPEDLDLKLGVLREAASVVDEHAVIASNTSSLPITRLAQAVSQPERFIGLHFFNPVPASGLVEVITGSETSPDVLARAQGWVRALGKTAVTVQDAPGFASSRLGVALALEAIRMLEEGVASAADIDAAMVKGYRHHTGPLRTTDLVGLDVRLAIAEHLASELGERFRPPRLLRDMVSAGQLGAKTGHGFYDWPAG